MRTPTNRPSVHRDVKPSNLMITPASAATRTDRLACAQDPRHGRCPSSCARCITPAKQLSTLTQGGSVIGTADFVAPEQLEDPHGADVRADLYSLGCTFYFVLVGEVPFPGGSLVHEARQAAAGTCRRRSTRLRPTSCRLASRVVVTKMLAKSPAERYQSPAELVAAFDELVRTGYQSSVPKGPMPCELRSLTGHADIVHAVALTADARLAASTGRDRTVRLWDLRDAKRSRILAQIPHEGRALAFDPAGDKLAVAAGISIRLWDVATGQELRRFSGHSAAVRALVFSTDGKWLFSGSDDKTIRIWDVPVGREMQRLARHTGAVTCLAVSPDGAGLLSGSRDGTLRRWDLRSGQVAGQFEPAGSGGGGVLAAWHLRRQLPGRLHPLRYDPASVDLSRRRAARGAARPIQQMVAGVAFLARMVNRCCRQARTTPSAGGTRTPARPAPSSTRRRA